LKREWADDTNCNYTRNCSYKKTGPSSGWPYDGKIPTTLPTDVTPLSPPVKERVGTPPPVVVVNGAYAEVTQPPEPQYSSVAPEVLVVVDPLGLGEDPAVDGDDVDPGVEIVVVVGDVPVAGVVDGEDPVGEVEVEFAGGGVAVVIETDTCA